MRTLVRCCLCNFIIFIHWCSIASAQLVSIPDSNLKQVILETLNLSDEIPLTQQEMLRLTRLVAKEKQIENLTGLEYATNLTVLRLPQNEASDLTPLAGLMHLRALSIWGNPISDLSPLANLTELSELNLGACRISDITPLTNLTQLQSLSLHYNLIEDLSALAKLTQLTKLHLNNNRIMDVSPLANLANLMALRIGGNSIRDFSPLLGLDLEMVDIDIHMLHELASAEVEIPDPNLERAIREQLILPDGIPVTQLVMKQLTRLDAGDNQIEDLAGLETCY